MSEIMAPQLVYCDFDSHDAVRSPQRGHIVGLYVKLKSGILAFGNVGVLGMLVFWALGILIF